MATQFEAKVFETEIQLKTYRNLFPADVPTGKEAFESLVQNHEQNRLPNLSFFGRTFYISDASHDGDWIKLLLHMTDPEIRDRDYADLTDGSLRTAARRDGEEPAFSSHVIVYVGNEFDTRRAYPCIIEEAESLSRTIIMHAINQYLDRLFAEERVRPEKNDRKTFRVTASLRAPLDQTIEGMLNSGAKLEEIKVTENALKSVVHGDEAYEVEEKRQLSLKVEGRPFGDRARDLLSNFYGSLDRGNKKSLKVVLYDPENETHKTVPVNLKDDNILQNAFIRKVLLSGFSDPLKECDGVFREDLLEEMIGLVNVEGS